MTFCWLNKCYWYCMVFFNVLYLPVISLLSPKPTISHREHFSVWLVCVHFVYTCIRVIDKVLLRKEHCRQRAPVGNALPSSGTSQIGMFDIQATTKSKYYDHIVLLYLESRRCRYRSIIFDCFYLYITVVIFIDYSDIDKMMDINNEKC